MPTSVHLPVTARPALRVSRSASGADVVVAALTGAEGSATGAKIVGLAPRAVKEAETSLGTDLASLAIRMGGSPKPGSTVILPWKSGSLVL
ncbi:MAG: leucyl aminopeptidase, partial [Cutibacterium granulosum]|nr:leucyl aminopeptidase [Cutibacterium granulosum]